MTDVKHQVRKYLSSVLGSLPSGSLEVESTADPLDEYARAYAKLRSPFEGLAIDAVADPAEELQSLRENLESIILPRERPALLIQDDDFSTPPAPWEQLSLHRSLLQQAVKAVGRIDIQLPSGSSRRASGFLVAENLFMTNRHVSDLFVSGVGGSGLSFLPKCSARVDFKSEYERADQHICEVVEPVLVHPIWDLALLRLKGAEAITPLALVEHPPENLRGRPVATIGYPVVELDLKTLPLQIEVFNGIFERKRMQPGTLMGEETISYLGAQVRALTHDCSTLGGNSGSAVVDVESGLVIGLHFAGLHMQANYAVAAWELAQDAVVRRLGVRFQRLPSASVLPTEPGALPPADVLLAAVSDGSALE